MTVEFQLMQRLLDSLVALHLDMRQQIIKPSKPRADASLMAGYLLTGRVITHSYAALRLLELGYIAEAGILVRSMLETQWLYEYFDQGENEAIADLGKWLAGEIVQPKKVRRGISSFDDWVQQTNDFMYHELSHYTHPTVVSSAINMDGETYEYGFQGNRYSKWHRDLVAGYAVQALMAAVLSFVGGGETLPFRVKKDTSIRLLEATKEAMQQWTDQWPEDTKRVIQFHINDFTAAMESILNEEETSQDAPDNDSLTRR